MVLLAAVPSRKHPHVAARGRCRARGAKAADLLPLLGAGGHPWRGRQAGGRVTRSGRSPDSLQPGRVGAQRHAEAAAEPDAAVRGDQPAPARLPPAVPGPRLVPLPHPGGNETGDRGAQPFPGEGGGLGAWRGTAHSPGCRDTVDRAAYGPSGRSLVLTSDQRQPPC